LKEPRLSPRRHRQLLTTDLGVAGCRYVCTARPPTRSQTWRTFFANHFSNRTFMSPVRVADASGDDIVVNACDVSSRPTQLSINGSCVSVHWAVQCDVPFRSTFLAIPLWQDHLQGRTGAYNSTGRDPPTHPWLQRLASRHGILPCVPAVLFDRRHREVMLQREFSIRRSESPS